MAWASVLIDPEAEICWVDNLEQPENINSNANGMGMRSLSKVDLGFIFIAFQFMLFRYFDIS
jgi:hypothetical protein